MPGEEEKEEGHKFIEHLLISEAFCPVHRDLVSLNSHMDPVRAVLREKLKPTAPQPEDGKTEICTQVYLISLKDAASSWGEEYKARKGWGKTVEEFERSTSRATAGAWEGDKKNQN